MEVSCQEYIILFLKGLLLVFQFKFAFEFIKLYLAWVLHTLHTTFPLLCQLYVKYM